MRPSDRPIRPGSATWALTVLTALHFINFLDRYILSAVLPSIRVDPAFIGISDARLGMLASAFMTVHMLASPFAGVFGDRVQRRVIIAIGVIIWSGATIWSAYSRTYDELLMSRALV